jgi:hypothetical protein
MTWTLRSAAVLIAIAGLIDPAFTTAGHRRARVAVIVQGGPTMELPVNDGRERAALRRIGGGGRAAVRNPGGMPRHAVAERARAQLVNDLGDDYDLQPRLTSDAAAAIVIGDSYPSRSQSDVASGFSRTVATVTVASDVVPNVRVVRVDAPREVPAGTAIRVGIDVEGVGVAGRMSTLTVHAGGLEVGRASHDWRGDGDRWHADIDAVPVGEPPFVLRVEAQPFEGERTSIDNAVDAVVDVRRAPFRVEVYEPRPSWATTFIRRALEADARFRVAGLSATSKSVTTRTGDAVSLADAPLDVIVVGGLDRLTQADAQALDRFMRARGGAVVVAPDAKVSAGPASRLLQGFTLTERLSERPEKLTVAAPLAPIQASEVLLVRSDAGADRLAWTSGTSTNGPSPVMVSTPRGDGRLVVSGALDAWRYRTEDAGAFDRFWQSTIAGLALAVPPPIDVRVEPPILRPGEPGEIIVRTSTRGAGLSGQPYERTVGATVDGRPIRLWPAAETGVFRGSFTARETDGRSTIVAQVDGASSRSASRPIVVRADARRALPETPAPLALLSASHNGIDVTPSHIDEVERFIRRTVTAPAAPVTRRPMRSVWWMIPFTACLSAEWYLRRRRGER